jgi:hypothetical protein
MQDDSESHPIAGVFTPRLVARLQRDAFDGALRFHSGSATRVVYFRRGDIASAASNAEDDRLHNILIHEGRLSGPQVDMARSRLRPGATLGKTLIELGFLTPAELLSGARRQVRQILAACFALNEGVYQVSAGPLGPEVTNLGLPVRRLIFDALMESGERRTIVGEMGSMESVYGPTAALGEALPALRLDPAAEEVARRLDGRATLREISGRTHLDDFTVSKIILALEIMGLAEAISRPEEETRPAAAIAARPGRVIPVESAETADHGAPAAAVSASTTRVPVLVSAPAGRNAPDADTGFPHPSEPIPASEPAVSHQPAIPSTPAFASSPHGRSEQADASPPADMTHPSSNAGRDDFDDEGEHGEADSSEPPPFAHDELPAFAVPETPQDGWRVDAETGERIHEGPVEMTFDGAVVPPSERASTGSRWVGIGVVLAVVAFAALLAFRLRSPSSDATPAGGGVAARPAPEAAPAGTATETIAGSTAKKETAPEPPPRSEPEAAPAEAAPPKTAPSDGAPSGPEQPPVAPAVAPPRAPETPAVAETPHSRPAPPAQTAPPRPGAPADEDLGSGQSRLDAGDVAGAGAIFARMVAATPADNLTLQVLIACETENILKARNATRPDGPLFVVPFRLQGRSCWRVCWGRYGDRDAAHAAAAAMPPYFTTAGLTPVVVSFGRLRPPG